VFNVPIQAFSDVVDLEAYEQVPLAALARGGAAPQEAQVAAR